MSKDNREKIVGIEKFLDDYNAKNGTPANLCLFCHAITYDGKQGIIHKPDCIILELRSVLALFPDESEIIGKIKLTVETELALERDIIKQINEAKIEEAKKQGYNKALRCVLRVSSFESPYELRRSIRQALKGDK